MKDLKTKWLPLAAVVASLWAGGMTSAQAAICEASSAITDPDASVTDSVKCGSGTLNTNDDFEKVRLAENVVGYNLMWNDLVTKVAATNGQTDFSGTSGLGTLRFTSNDAQTSGTWFLTTSLALASNDFLMVVKDGGVTDTNSTSKPQDKISWFWFILDEVNNTSNVDCGESTLCGKWTMFGDPKGPNNTPTLQAISHMSVYYAPRGSTPPLEVPEPGPLSLLGLGLMGLWFARRKMNA